MNNTKIKTPSIIKVIITCGLIIVLAFTSTIYSFHRRMNNEANQYLGFIVSSMLTDIETYASYLYELAYKLHDLTDSEAHSITIHDASYVIIKLNIIQYSLDNLLMQIFHFTNGRRPPPLDRIGIDSIDMLNRGNVFDLRHVLHRDVTAFLCVTVLVEVEHLVHGLLEIYESFSADAWSLDIAHVTRTFPNYRSRESIIIMTREFIDFYERFYSYLPALNQIVTSIFDAIDSEP